MLLPRKNQVRLAPAGVALLYAAFTALWIAASGYLLAFTVSDPQLRHRIELSKGLVFVALGAGRAADLIRHCQAVWPAIEREVYANLKVIAQLKDGQSKTG